MPDATKPDLKLQAHPSELTNPSELSISERLDRLEQIELSQRLATEEIKK